MDFNNNTDLGAVLSKLVQPQNKPNWDGQQSQQNTDPTESRRQAVLGLLKQGVTDPQQMLQYLNFDEQGQQIGDFRPEELLQYIQEVGQQVQQKPIGEAIGNAVPGVGPLQQAGDRAGAVMNDFMQNTGKYNLFNPETLKGVVQDGVQAGQNVYNGVANGINDISGLLKSIVSGQGVPQRASDQLPPPSEQGIAPSVMYAIPERSAPQEGGKIPTKLKPLGGYGKTVPLGPGEQPVYGDNASDNYRMYLREGNVPDTYGARLRFGSDMDPREKIRGRKI